MKKIYFIVIIICFNHAITNFIDSWKHEKLTRMQLMKRTPQVFFWNFK